MVQDIRWKQRFYNYTKAFQFLTEAVELSHHRSLTALDDMLLPYVFDLSLFDTLDNLKLKQHISSVGIIFYQADSL